MIVDMTSMAMGRSTGALHSLPERIRAQTALDYTRTAPGVYHVPNTGEDLTQYLPSISLPTLVVWGDRDQTLSPPPSQNLSRQCRARWEMRACRACAAPIESGGVQPDGEGVFEGTVVGHVMLRSVHLARSVTLELFLREK